LFLAGLAALLAWCAAHGVAEQIGLPTSVLWVLAGVAAGEAWGAGRAALSAWLDLRRLRRNPAYAAAVAELDSAYERAERLAGRGGER
jgi:hypothetical protein